MNFSRLFGVDAEYMYYDLSIRPSVANGPANLHNTSGRLQSISLDGIVNVPYHRGKLHAYGIFGVGFYRAQCFGEPPSAPDQRSLPAHLDRMVRH